MNEDVPDWDPTVQRSRLKGFARLRAILWPRSLRLVEAAALGGQSWYWKLRWHHWRAFRSVDLHSRGRLTEQALVYGATPVLTVWKLLELCRILTPQHPREFIDLGSGNGLVALASACKGYRAVGFELERDWVQRSSDVARALSIDCRFRAEDFRYADWPERAVVFAIGTAFSSEMREDIQGRFTLLKDGSLFVLGDWSLPEPYRLLWQGRLPVDWGVICFSIYTRSIPSDGS